MTKSDLFARKKFFSRIFRDRPFCTTDGRKNLKKNFFDRRGPIGHFFENIFFDFVAQNVTDFQTVFNRPYI